MKKNWLMIVVGAMLAMASVLRAGGGIPPSQFGWVGTEADRERFKGILIDNAEKLDLRIYRAYGGLYQEYSFPAEHDAETELVSFSILIPEIESGQYRVYAEVMSGNGFVNGQLFSNSMSSGEVFDIFSGVTTTLKIKLDFPAAFLIPVVVDNLQGIQEGYNYSIGVDWAKNNGLFWGQDNSAECFAGQLNFWVWASLPAIGHEEEIFISVDGREMKFAINSLDYFFSGGKPIVLDAGGPTPTETGSLEASVVFVGSAADSIPDPDPLWFVKIGTQEFSSLQEAIDAAKNNDCITLGSGEYQGFHLVGENKIISITGQGADQTWLRGYGDPAYVIYISGSGSYPIDASVSPLAMGLNLINLMVSNRDGADNINLYDAAIYSEFAELTIDNCAVASFTNPCVSVGYSVVSINHSCFIGRRNAGLVAQKEDSVSVANSIWFGFDLVFGYTEGKFIAKNNCVYDYLTMFNCYNDPDLQLSTDSFVLADPRLGKNFHLMDDSPCRRAASDGQDIGIVWKGKSK